VDPVADTFTKLALRLNYPIFIVTTAVGERREGCVIGFATQASIDPGRFLACLSRENRTYRLARDAEALAVHFAPAADDELVELFGGETGDEIDKFEHCEWHDGPCGVPILAGCPSWFVGEILSRHDLGDHVGHLLRPVQARCEPGDVVYFQDVKDLEPGHPA
jgi:flavin reductase (DIM6/NTAB) family NADH-FMN oxidoreductase RutF